MFGSELALGTFSDRGKLFCSLFGHWHIGHHVRAIHLRKILTRVDVPRTILDAGSGDGSVSFYLAKRYSHAEIAGVEIDRRKVEECNLITSRLGRGNTLSFIQGDLQHYNPSRKFDLICCIDVLEHIKDDERVLRNLCQSLSKDGILLLHVPGRHQDYNFHFGWLPPASGMMKDHVRDEYTEKEIERKLELAGFCIEQRRYTFGWFGSLARELFYVLEQFKAEMSFLGAILKASLFPLLIWLAYLDTLTQNTQQHQGFFYRLRGTNDL